MSHTSEPKFLARVEQFAAGHGQSKYGESNANMAKRVSAVLGIPVTKRTISKARNGKQAAIYRVKYAQDPSLPPPK